MKILGKKISRLKFDYWLSVGETEGTYRKMVLLLLEIKSTTAQDLHLIRHVTTKRCPYCQNGLKSLGKRDPDAQESDWYEICTDCGFWRHHEADKMFNDRFQFSAIKRFRDSDTSPSISHLCSEIKAGKIDLYDMEPSRFERFVGSVLSDFYHCEVHHVARSGDDGVDLLAIVRDDPIMIQVKRRKNVDAIEGVNTVKLLFASAFARRANLGMVVTTAKAFSRPSEQWIKRQRLKEVKFIIKLTNVSDLMTMIDAIASPDQEPPWVAHRKNYFGHMAAMVGVTRARWYYVEMADGEILMPENTNSPVLIFDHGSLDEYTSAKISSLDSLELLRGKTMSEMT